MSITKNRVAERLRETYRKPVMVSGHVGVDIGHGPSYAPLAPYKLTTRYEYMLDTVNYRDTFSNPCAHDKTIYVPQGTPSLSIWSTELSVPLIWSFPEKNGIYVRDAWEIFRTLESGAYKGYVDDFSERARKHFVTAIDVEVLSWNFMVDTISMIGLFKGIAKQILKRLASGQVPRNVWKQRRHRKRKLEKLIDPGRAVKKTSDDWLLWNFAVKPMIKDITALVTMQEETMKRLNWLRQNNGNIVRVKYREGPRTWEDSISLSSSSCFPSAAPGFDYIKPSDCYVQLDYRMRTRLAATAAVKFDIDTAFLYSDSAYRWALAVRSGLLAIGSTIWEGIPFSFVIDWFLSEKMKNAPDALDYSPFPDATIHEVAHSVKTVVEGSMSFIAPPATEVGPMQSIDLGAFQYQAFVRKVGFPQAGGPIFRVPWSGHKLSLAAALFGQRIRR